MGKNEKVKKSDDEGHRKRIRNKFYNNEIENFEEYEILELLLTYCILRKDTKPIAKELLRKFKTLKCVLKADRDNLLNINGIGEKTVLFLQLLGNLENIMQSNELIERDIDSKKNLKILNKEILLNYLKEKIGYEEIEKFYVIYLMSSNKVIDIRELSSGTLDRSSVYPREIYRDVINLNAKSIILAHNHPSGNITPSKSDIELTNEIAKGLKNFGAILIEHIIMTKNFTDDSTEETKKISYFSFLEEGLI